MYIFLGGGDYSWFNIIFSSNQKRKKKHSIPLAPLVNMPSQYHNSDRISRWVKVKTQNVNSEVTLVWYWRFGTK